MLYRPVASDARTGRDSATCVARNAKTRVSSSGPNRRDVSPERRASMALAAPSRQDSTADFYLAEVAGGAAPDDVNVPACDCSLHDPCSSTQAIAH
jgi:hypothetical protein